MKRLTVVVLAALTLLSLVACGAEKPTAPTVEAPKPIAEQVENVAATEKPTVTEEPTTEKPVSPYAWLGYEELPQCNYFDILSTGVFYREYDSYISGYSVPTVQASDGVNTYQFDGSNRNAAANGLRIRETPMRS